MKNNEPTWGDLFKKFLCGYIFLGHKLKEVDCNVNAKYCTRCDEVFWNIDKMRRDHKKKNRSRKFGKRYF